MRTCLITLPVSLASAFAGRFSVQQRSGHRVIVVNPPSSFLRLHAEPEPSPPPSSATPEEGAAGKELVSTLARIDKSWNIQQKFRPQSRWKELVVDGSKVVHLLEPPGSTLPSSVLVFWGGAGLGQFPHIAYNELLLRISNRLNASILAVPYSIALDHFDVAKGAGEAARLALIQCEDTLQYPASLPVYCLAHSLGCKLSTIYMAATDQEYDGVAFMSYNNFGFGRTIGMAREFADAIGASVAMGQAPPGFRKDGTRKILEQVFELAESAVSMIGIEFSPSPLEMNRLIRLKYPSRRQQTTRMFSFDDDSLENTEEFVQACDGPGPLVSGLPGTHLTPVFFKLDLLENADDLPEDAREAVLEAMGGYRSVSFGNEEQLDALVDEVCGFILGKEPTRQARWQRERPLLAGTSANRTSSSDNP